MTFTWPVFITAFCFIFVAALPGRTTFVMLIMSARDRPWGVFLGAAAAFACQSIISVLLGRLVALFPQHWVQLAAGILFIFFALMFWRESRHGVAPTVQIEGGARRGLIHVVRSTFLIIFAAEWGDVSQVAIASTAARSREQLTVFFSALTALWSIAGMAVLIGSRLSKVISPTLIQKGASIVFLLIGLYLIASSVAR